MKFSSALALGAAPLALAKAVNNVYPGRRGNGDMLESRDGHAVTEKINSIKASPDQITELSRLLGLNTGSNVEINFLWVNLGGGAATTVVNQASTVTVTATVNGDAAATAAPPAETAAPGDATAVAPPGAGATHSVTVGGPQGLKFDPPELAAAIGDTVIFTFLSQNHTATQSSFDVPCKALEGGMDSGYQANPNNTVNPPPQVAMQVMVETPLWFYCRQGNHCGKGMTFSINPTAEKTHAMFQAMAIAQNGTGDGGAITGNPPPADPNAPPADAPPASAPPADAATSTGAAGAIVTGVGNVGADGACVCAVQCSFGETFPAAAQGLNSFGGVGGAIPMAMAQGVPAPARRS